jgi:long-subunit fatty acid transport protein
MKHHVFKGSSFIVLVILLAVLGLPAYGAEVEIPSSFNPVGSGARAMGMGGAFIAVADDATAASWNPGGLSQLKHPECSAVTSLFHRYEDIRFGTNPEADGSHDIFDANINYLSLSYPFKLLNREMIVSLSYQHLYDFNREWDFTLHQEVGRQISDNNWTYKQSGSLSALGISYSARIIPQLSLGFTLNVWDSDLSPNRWEETYQKITTGELLGYPLLEKYNRLESHSLDGFNFNVGLLWYINYHWTFGAVFKSPFKADVKHKFQETSVTETPFFKSESQDYILDEELELPMSYGIGFVYNVSDNFSISADIYRTEWDDCIYRDADGNETSPITDGSPSDIKPTHQVRMGFEYRFINKEKQYLVPIRGGVFYDPAPAAGNPDDFYGIAMGLGFSKNEWFSLDIAYQYRFGNDTGYHLVKGREFSQDVDEHMVYLSLIWYRF